MRVALGLCLGMFLILGGFIMEGGHLSSIIQFTSGCIALGGALGALVITYPLPVITQSFVLASTGREADRLAYLSAAGVFRTFGDLCVLSGLVGATFGLIHSFENIHKGVQYIGPGLAITMVPILYGLLVKLFLGKPLSDSFMARAVPTNSVEESVDSRTEI